MALVVIAAFLTLTSVIAQTLHYPTYHYYGRTLSVDEFLDLVRQEVPLHCTPLPSAAMYLGDFSKQTDIICFNTQEEVTSYLHDVLNPQWDKIMQENPVTYPASAEGTTLGSQKLLQTDHWALYGSPYYLPPHLADIGNGTNCYANSGVWSLWRDGVPHDITLWGPNNCTRTPSFTFSAPVFSCGIAWPIYCGGSQGASVP